jgi:hypothetical protein
VATRLHHTLALSGAIASLLAARAAEAAPAPAPRPEFSSFGAAATVLPKAFCSARAVSNAWIAARRARSAAIASSTVETGTPRASCEWRTASGFSRSSCGSITFPSY